MKAMLEKSTLALSKVKVEEERTETFVPTSAQLEMIEAEGFENTKFVSHRTAGKVNNTISEFIRKFMSFSLCCLGCSCDDKQ